MCGVGNTAPEVWRQLLAGASGMAPIQGFDTTGFPVTFAAEVKNFDPLNFVDKKESRKMGRFIHFAFAATQEAMAQSGLKITPEIADRVGVFIGSGIGGFEIIEREHSNLLAGGPRKISPFFIPAVIVNMAAGQISIRYGAQGPISATATACATSANSIGDSVRMIMHGDADVMIAGGVGGFGHAAVGGRIRCDARALDAQRRADAGQPALRQGSRRICDRRRRGHSDSGRAGVCEGARREDSGRGDWLRHERRCVSHDGHRSRGRGRTAQHAGGAERRGHCSRKKWAM